MLLQAKQYITVLRQKVENLLKHRHLIKIGHILKIISNLLVTTVM